MNISALHSAGSAISTQQRDMPPIRKPEQIQVDAKPESATVEIRTRNPEMETNWPAVYQERGFLQVEGQVKEIKAIAQERYAQAVQRRVQGGLRARNLHLEQGNVFGRIAFDNFLASRKKTIEIAALPKLGLKIDVRIYPPEIKVETNFKWERDGLS